MQLTTDQLATELVRLSELHERGDLSGEQFEQAKGQLLGTYAPDGALLLYNLVATGLRRAVWVLAVVALLFGCVAIWSASRYASLEARADSIEEAALVEGFRVSIPDPRPTIERAQIRVRAAVFGGLAAVTGLIALGALSTALLIQPPKLITRRPQPGR